MNDSTLFDELLRQVIGRLENRRAQLVALSGVRASTLDRFMAGRRLGSANLTAVCDAVGEEIR
ncbi:MAG: hypothetical protein JSS27_10205 [Planctomycetes bacterium]|nr:hypothetical protein [Planctomycetota bacterium]